MVKHMEQGLEFEQLEQTDPSREEIDEAIFSLFRETSAVGPNYSYNISVRGLIGEDNFNTIRAVLTKALERAR